MGYIGVITHLLTIYWHRTSKCWFLQVIVLLLLQQHLAACVGLKGTQLMWFLDEWADHPVEILLYIWNKCFKPPRRKIGISRQITATNPPRSSKKIVLLSESPTQIAENSSLGIIVIVFFPRYIATCCYSEGFFFLSAWPLKNQSRPSRGAPAAPKKVPGAPSVRVTRVVTLRGPGDCMVPIHPWRLP